MKLSAILPKLFLVAYLFLLLLPDAGAQNNTMPAVLDSGRLVQQYDYLDNRTRIYNGFRAIREDMFQKIRKNAVDSLRKEQNTILYLKDQAGELNADIDSLDTELTLTKTELDTAIRNRDRLKFLGIPMHKALYNTIIWAIIAGLLLLSGTLFLSAKRLGSSSISNKRDLEELREEFETYRKTTRERQEQLVVKHHNEIRKLKGK